MEEKKKWEDDWSTKTMNTEHQDLTENMPKAWMIRKCHCYYDEYKACSMIRTKIHHIFVHGEVQSCKHWYENFKDCKAWVGNKDINAANRIISREEKRLAERLLPHHLNDVWERRSSPPSAEEWNPPLPSYLQKNVNESIIGTEDDFDSNFRSTLKNFAASSANCAIM